MGPVETLCLTPHAGHNKKPSMYHPMLRTHP
jgi:hypothetical protein